jgi:hypothetical protein
MTRRNLATGQLYPRTIRDQPYAVLATAPALPGGLSSEVALVHLLGDGSYTGIHVTPNGKVIEDDPMYTDSEAVARDCFAFRTAENLRLYWESR